MKHGNRLKLHVHYVNINNTHKWKRIFNIFNSVQRYESALGSGGIAPCIL